MFRYHFSKINCHNIYHVLMMMSSILKRKNSFTGTENYNLLKLLHPFIRYQKFFLLQNHFVEGTLR